MGFAQGYEIEIKTALPSEEIIDEMLKKIKRNRGDRIFSQEVEPILQSLDKGQYLGQIQAAQNGPTVFSEVPFFS